LDDSTVTPDPDADYPPDPEQHECELPQVFKTWDEANDAGDEWRINARLGRTGGSHTYEVEYVDDGVGED
jgi:hypothetical protein